MIVVEKPGLRTTVQDLGRVGLAHIGVPRSGAADSFSMRLANALVANPEGDAVLETTFVGPALRFFVDTVVAVAGAPVRVTVDGQTAAFEGSSAFGRSSAFGCSFCVRAGQLVELGRAEAGLRSYLAVAGGIDVPAVLGSRSTDTLSGLGPALLAAGDALAVGAPDSALAGVAAPSDLLSSVLPTRAVRIVRGPSSEWFSDAAWNALCTGDFVVSPRSDRVGARLTGPSIERRADEVPTGGMVAGAIQVPPDGNPVVLLADHAVTGGYPVIAVVASVDLPLIAQARPGTAVGFVEVSPAQAATAFRDAEERLASVRG